MGSWDEAERELRERIESVRVRERELVEVRAQLARRLADLDKTKGSRRHDKLLTEREQQLAAREEELEAKFAAAEQREREAVSKLAFATAEREKLDERERAVKDAERDLAKQRRRLQEEHAALSTVEPPPPPSEVKPQTDPEPHAWQATPW
jgi:chromosome segregation ATPase